MLPQALGVAGGKPSSSLYFIGFQDSNAFYLDPHSLKSALYDLQTIISTLDYHTDLVGYTPISEIDPSMLIGFYLMDLDDFAVFETEFEGLQEKYPVVSIVK